MHLPWDSEFFGVKIARLTVSRLTHAMAEEALAWSEENDVDCLYFLSDADDAETVTAAEDLNFRLVDIRLTLDRTVGPGGVETSDVAGQHGSQHGTIRPHRSEDVQALRAIAGKSHHDSRFYFDPNFSEARCDALYETWIEKSCNGYAERVFVVDVQGEAQGYISCHLPAEGEGQIGLLGLAPQAQGKGLGQRLVNEALRWFATSGVKHVSVVTQGRNSNAQRLYQRCGFVTRQTQLWYHRWFTRGGIIGQVETEHEA